MSDHRGAEERVERLSGGLDRPTLVVAGVATLGLIMAVLDTTIVNVALDTLSRDLQARLSTIQWVSTGYLLSLASVIPLSGWITERFGSKRTWIAAIVVFALGSGLCALATSASELIAFRVVQGFGGGMLVPVGFTLVAQSAGPRRIGRALALVGVPILLGPIFGPIVGGLIVDNAAWRWIFVVNVPIAVLATVVAARALKPDAGRADAGALDWLGAVLLCPGLAGVVFGLSETASHGGIDHPIAFGPMLAGFALIGLFVWHSLRVARPLIELRLFRSRGFRAVSSIIFLLGGALFGTLLVLPLYYQVDRGESALNAGLLLAPQGIGTALMLPISGRLTDRLGGGPVVVAGITTFALGTLPLTFVSGSTPYALLGAVLFVRGLGLGASMQPATAAAYALLDSAQVPRATAAINTLRQVGGSIGTALLSVVLQHESGPLLSSTSGGAEGLLAPLTSGERAQVGGSVATPSATPSGGRLRWRSWPSSPPSRSCVPSAPPGGRTRRVSPRRGMPRRGPPGPKRPDADTGQIAVRPAQYGKESPPGGRQPRSRRRTSWRADTQVPSMRNPAIRRDAVRLPSPLRRV